MRLRIRIAVIICAVAVAVGLWFFRTRTLPPEPLPQAVSESATTPAGTSPTVVKNSAEAASAGVQPPVAAQPAELSSPVATTKIIRGIHPFEPEFTNLPPAVVLENMRLVFRNYISMFGSNPVGTNPEITQALDGGNRKQTHFLSAADGLRINGRGELIDPWGTPYFFHQLSGTEMEIHSAGPDRVMWTADDLVSK